MKESIRAGKSLSVRPVLTGYLPLLLFLLLIADIFAIVWLISIPNLLAMAAILLISLLFAIFLWLMINLEAAWVFDSESRTAFYHFRADSWQKVVPVCRFDDIAGIFTQGRQNRDRIRTWWDYRVMMKLKSGKIHNVSDLYDENPDECNDLARSLAQIAGCDFFAGQEEKVTRIRLLAGSPSVSYHFWGWKDVFREFSTGIIVTMLFIAALSGLIVSLVFILSSAP